MSSQTYNSCCSRCNYSLYKQVGWLDCHYKHEVNYSCAIYSLAKNSCTKCYDLETYKIDTLHKKTPKVRINNKIASSDGDFFIKGKTCSRWSWNPILSDNENEPPFRVLTPDKIEDMSYLRSIH